MRGALAAPGVDHEPLEERQLRRRRSAARRRRARRACARRPAPRRSGSGRARARRRAVAPPGASGRGAASPIRSIVKSGSAASARACGCALHSSALRIMATTAPASFAAVSKSSPFQPRERRRDRLARVRAAEQLDDRAAVVREVRVQADEAAVAGAVHARDRVPHGRRVPPRDPQVALAAELERRRAQVDRDPLRAPAAQAPELGGREPGRRDRRPARRCRPGTSTATPDRRR